ILSNELSLADAIQATSYDNLDIIAADMSARQADILLNEMKQSKKKIAAILSTVKKEYDIVVLDCPPGISVLHDAVFSGADWILMPNIPTT
uniref:AAA family ATPase n=1 Tax=Klebsiella pneumoniae TaxID=573 RepID=UPI0013D742EE